MPSRRLKIWAMSASFRCPADTITALSRLNGATRESTKEIMSLRASRAEEAREYRGDMGLSVMAITSAPLSWANCTPFTVDWEYLGKLMPTSTSPGAMRRMLSRMSPALLLVTRVTLSKIRWR